MPLYIYKCVACETEFESIESMDAKEIDCPECSELAERQFAASKQRLEFNCDGFHTTDYDRKKVR